MTNDGTANGTLTTGEAAHLIEELTGHAISRQTVRRLIENGVLEARWTRPASMNLTDAQGRPLRGWRRVIRASVERYAESVKAEG